MARVRLLRELLVEPHAVQTTPAGTEVDMDDARAKELSKREPPLVEILGAKAAAPVENKMSAELANKAAAPTEADAASPERDESGDRFEREPVRPGRKPARK